MSFKNLISFDEIAETSINFLDIDSRPDWEEVFGNPNPLNLEVGFGVGNFLIEMGIREPDENFIGMDFYHKGIRKVITRIDKYQVQNVRIVYGDAKEKLPILFNDEELSRVYVNFPDPWPKKRHHKRRLIKPAFIQIMAEKLKSGGEVHIATDYEPYAVEILEFFEKEPALKNKSGFGTFLSQKKGVPQTKYEKKFLSAGEKIFYLEFVKQ
ncbi:tRNA (guanine-N7)-methyltransferase [Candidatus Nitromaritima sp. SCGC AAA799-C22]|nr:tRNA (guanine-N7)-methyltransferase [Candidatus Nitromaritima sp. SCGC AAA799-C22]